ncbi:MAG: hypothetical protein E7314_01295 [Clostridiales bacterium]|nr:hypothetical protein [Clostridiales bacterium]
MEYKICENCGAKLHSRTLKCPECNTLLTDASQIVNDTTNIENTNTETINQTLGENIDVKISDTESIIEQNPENISQEDTKKSSPENVKDYVYKAEVRHSLEYTNQLSNSLKVFLTALSTIPLFGQFIGTFFGIFFLTYDDNDRKTFGKALLILSIIIFIFYFYNLVLVSQMISSGNINNYLNNFVK